MAADAGGLNAPSVIAAAGLSILLPALIILFVGSAVI